MPDETTKPRAPTRRLRTAQAYELGLYRCSWCPYYRVVCIVENPPVRRRLDFRFVGLN